MHQTHSEYGGSGAARWLKCHASIPESLKAHINPFDNQSYANEGTLAHELARLRLDGVLNNPHPSNGHKFTRIENDMVRHVERYVKYVQQELRGEPVHAEQRVSWESIIPVPNAGGTIDAWGIVDNVCHLFDLKYGQGIEVFAKNNKQLLTYATGLSLLPECKDVAGFVGHIFQPRLKGPEHWPIDHDMIAKHKEQMVTAYEGATSTDPTYAPSPETCQWCPALLTCQKVRDIMQNVILHMTGKPAPTLNKMELSVLKNRKVVWRYLSMIERKAIATILIGMDVPGFKLKKKEKRRIWTKEAEEILKLLLGDKAFQTTLKSITSVRPMVPTGVINELTFKPPSTEQVLAEKD